MTFLNNVFVLNIVSTVLCIRPLDIVGEQPLWSNMMKCVLEHVTTRRSENKFLFPFGIRIHREMNLWRHMASAHLASLCDIYYIF